VTEQHDQLTKGQLTGMFLLGACVWAVIIGVIYAVIAEDSYPGLVIAVTGGIGGYALYRWLIFVNKPKE
jgi:nitrogen fixation protein FixH